MLLPRHLADLYAATFQVEQWKEVGDVHSANDIARLHHALGLRPDSNLNPVLQAKAYQAMLLQGTKAPAWLRQKVSPLLSQLACTDLFSIIQVFCPTQEAPMASQRLGLALAGAPSKKALMQQILGILQVAFPTGREVSGPAVSILETVWAVLNQWSPETIRAELIDIWEMSIMETDTQGSQIIHRTVRQIGALFSFVPNARISLKVLQQLPKSIILPQLVRLACMSSIFTNKARDDAKQTLHWISQAICSVTESAMIGSVIVSTQSLMAIAWVHSLEPSSWDFSGNEYYIQDLETHSSSLKGIECVGIDDDEDVTSAIQIASIILSLLVSVLEFGSTLRSPNEEAMLQSFLPLLASLAQLRENRSNLIPSYIEELNTDMADIAAYALSLIASRAAPHTREARKLDSQSRFDELKDIMIQSENDLRSAEPPIRARGIVEIGRLARGYLGIIAKENLPKGSSSLINVVEGNESASSNEITIDFVVNETLRISIAALGDKESYVYLAAVQTIVSVGDMRPKKMIPLVASILVTGKWKLDSPGMAYQSIDVTGEQRIKLAEALIFMIKRRAVVEEYVPFLIALMTFGNESATHNSAETEDPLFQGETHKYFMSEAKQEAGEYEPSQEELWEEMDIRLKTGGPVFKAEELDVVRAARASVLAALVSKSAPKTIASNCPLLVRLVNDTLVLETSRSVCRAITALARELYESALRELEEVLVALETTSAQLVTTRASIPFTVALVSSNEEVLHSNLVAKYNGGLTSSQHKLSDPATSARCKEALAFRQQAEETELLSCARLLVSQDLANRNYPQVLRILKSGADMGVRVKLSIE
ncbi:MAG: hypothetical protein SGBAC_005627 [Bacillariaceae sp.]